ncbi:EAL domain-containing protein [Lysobacter tyrosinilyticus]
MEGGQRRNRGGLCVAPCERAKLLVETIIAAGHHLQLTVVAEGVETQGQHAALTDAGCDLFQGYLYGRPMPEAAFREWLSVMQRRAGMATSTVLRPRVS